VENLLKKALHDVIEFLEIHGICILRHRLTQICTDFLASFQICENLCQSVAKTLSRIPVKKSVSISLIRSSVFYFFRVFRLFRGGCST